MLDLFSGIGGFSLAASWTGQIETITFCEIDKFCQKVLKKHWPDVPIFDDITKLRGEDIEQPVDIICGGFPCQPYSQAGKRRGKEDDRALWPEMFRVIREIKPKWILAENVAGFVNMGLEDCISELEGEGYYNFINNQGKKTIIPFIIPACAVGAPHRRDRVWIVANSGQQSTRGTQSGFDNREQSSSEEKERTNQGYGFTDKNCHASDSDRLNGNNAGYDTGEVSQLEASGLLGMQSITDSCNERLQGSEWTGSHEQGQATHGSASERNYAWANRGLKLQPAFVEWMQGYPIGYTDLKPSVTP
jgi:DNA (cytosine-5)-methyltransferase 1